MSKGFMPVAMREKAEKVKLFFFHLIVVLIISANQCALYYIIRQTVEPDGDVQLEVRCSCSNTYTDKVYWLVLPETVIEPIFISLPPPKLMFYNPLYYNEHQEAATIPTMPFTAAN